jgi:hypothetical protein
MSERIRPLRRRMIEDMTIRDLPRATQRSYMLSRTLLGCRSDRLAYKLASNPATGAVRWKRRRGMLLETQPAIAIGVCPDAQAKRFALSVIRGCDFFCGLCECAPRRAVWC